MSTTIQAPLPFQSPTADYATQLDAAYFDAHPGVTSRIRDVVSGEFPDLLAAGCSLVLVTQLSPGVRIRQPLQPPAPGEELGYVVVNAVGEVL